MSGADLNEYHADFLARDRLAEARVAATRREIVRSLRRPRALRITLGLRLISIGRRLVATARQSPRASTSRPCHRARASEQ